MGTCLCCDKTDPGEAFVTPDQFADKLVSQVSKPSDKKGEVMINLDVIETILMDGDGTVAKADEKYVSEQEVEKAIVRVNSKDLPRGSKSSNRKGTGYITKELPKFQAWMRKKPVSLGGPLMSYSEVESLYWIHSKNMDISFCGDLEAMQPSDSLRFFRGCAKWSSDQLSVDLERGFWIHARPQRAQSLHSICFDNVLATRDVWYAAMLAAVGPVLAEFPRGPAADPILKQALVNHYRAQATDIARQLFGPRSAEWERRLEAAKLCKAK